MKHIKKLIAFAIILTLFGGSPIYAKNKDDTKEKEDAKKQEQLITDLTKRVKDLQTEREDGFSEVFVKLQKGEKKSEVESLQALLSLDSSIYPEGLVTGYFGDKTRDAVKRFQKEHGLKQDGHVGSETIKKLRQFAHDNSITTEDDHRDGKHSKDKHGIKKPKILCTIIPPSHFISARFGKIWEKHHKEKKERNDKDRKDREEKDRQNGTNKQKDSREDTNKKFKDYVENKIKSKQEKERDRQEMVKNSIKIPQCQNLPPVIVGDLEDITPTPDPTDTTAPFITTPVVTIEVGTTSATITWDTDEDSQSIVWYRKISHIVKAESAIAEDTSFVTSHSVTLDGLTPGTVYYFMAGSTDVSGNSIDSEVDTFQTLIDITPPVVSDLTASNTSTTSTNIVWDTNEKTTDQIWISPSYPVNTSGAPNQQTTEPNDSHEIALSDLLPNTTYYYVIVSTDSAGNVVTVKGVFITTPA